MKELFKKLNGLLEQKAQPNEVETALLLLQIQQQTANGPIDDAAWAVLSQDARLLMTLSATAVIAASFPGKP